WLPACPHLGLRLVPHFHDGALSTVSPEDLSEIVVELEALRAWAARADNTAFVLQRVGGILLALRGSASESCEYDLGSLMRVMRDEGNLSRPSRSRSRRRPWEATVVPAMCGFGWGCQRPRASFSLPGRRRIP